MNNTEYEYSAEELKAISLARELHLMGNTATPAAIARFVRAWDERSATCQAQAALRTTASKLSDFFSDVIEPRIEFVQVPVRMLQQLSVAVKLAQIGPVTAPSQPSDRNLLLSEDGYPHVQQKPVQLALSWKNIPRSYIYAAMDADGRVFAYEKEPVKISDKRFYSVPSFRVDEAFVLSGPPLDQWQNSLIKRPEAI